MKGSPWKQPALLLLLVALCGLWLLRVDWEERLEDNVVALLPSGDGAEAAILNRLRDEQARLLLFTWEGSGEGAEEALLQRLRSSRWISSAAAGLGPEDPEGLLREVFEARYTLLLPDWWRGLKAEYARTEGGGDFPQWLAERRVERIEAFLDSPESYGQEPLVAEDPLLLFEALIAAGEAVLSVPESHLVWASLAVDPLDPETQEAVLDALSELLSEWQRQHPEVEGLAWSGALRFAEASRTGLKREVRWLNLVSVALVALVGAVWLGSPLRLLQLLVPVVVGGITGLTLSTLLFPEIHLLALVLGSVLAGIAIDYGIHLYLHRGREHARLVWRALLLSAASTIGGYSMLAFSSLAMIKQAGVFVGGGLVGALAACALYPPIRAGRAGLRHRVWLEKAWFGRIPKPRRRLVAAGLLLVALVGLGQAEWRDEVQMLDLPHPQLQAELERVIAATQGAGGVEGPIQLALGDDLLDAAGRLDGRAGAGQANAEGFARFLPSRKAIGELPAEREDWERFVSALAGALQAREFELAAFAGGLERLAGLSTEMADPAEWEKEAEQAAAALATHFRGPAGVLIGRAEEGAWLAVMPAPEGAGAENLRALDLRNELNRLLERWRQELLVFAVLGVGAILLILRFFFPWRPWARIVAVPLSALVVSLGWSALFAGELHLFHLMAALLGFCVTLDYAVFFVTSESVGAGFPASIRVSAMTTFVAFGALFFSRVSAVSGLGGTVALMVLVAMLAIEGLRE